MATPAPFDPEIADEICSRLVGGESLRSITSAQRDDFMPGMTTVFRWLKENEDFAKQYALAREAQADGFVDEMISIADAPNATTNATTGEVEVRDPARDRLRVDARKWVASKLRPKVYGDKLALDGDGEGGPIKVEAIRRVIVRPHHTDS